jgi:Zn-dependent protease with chaperone function
MSEDSPKWIWILAVVLAIPMFAYLVGEWAHSEYESEWQSVLLKQYPNSSATYRSQLTLTSVCDLPDMTGNDICRDLEYISLMQGIAILTAFLGLALLAGIAVAARSARGNRKRLLLLFRPGLFLTILCLVGLVALQVGLVCTSIYFGEIAAFDVVHPFVIGAAALGGLVGILSMISGVVGCLKPLSIPVIGWTLSYNDAPEIWDFVSEIAHRIGASVPQSIAVGLNDNFFVTDATVVTLAGKQTGPTMYLSLLMCRVLDRDELASVIGHELAHFKGEDTQYNERFMPIYRGASSALEQLTADIGTNLRSLVLLPAAFILGYFLQSFAVAEREIGRAREFEADHLAAKITDPILLAGALLKTHALNGLWDNIVEFMNATLRNGRVPANVGPLFEDIAFSSVLPDDATLRNLGSSHVPHPLDTHPPLEDRLRAIGWSVTSAVDIVQLPEIPATALVRNLEYLEESLTKSWCAYLYRIQHSDPQRTRDITPTTT